MKCYYDFHIHTALSPCGDDDMTPNNIVNMALLKGLDAIAVTDHNSFENVRSCMECAEGTSLAVIPGMELETAEEIHVLALFNNVQSLVDFGSEVKKSLPLIKNRVDIFGNQLIYDSDDNVTGNIENMLVTATTLDITSAVSLIRKFGGVPIPAHVDKSSYSIISNLGSIPEELSFTTVEVKNPLKIDKMFEENKLGDYLIIHNSDAHFLWDIHEREYFIEVNKNDIFSIINKLDNKI